MTVNIDYSRPLVVCEGGPKDGMWFYADDFAALQEATRRMANPHRPEAANVSLHYRPTRRTKPHPSGGEGQVAEWDGT